MKIKTKKKIVFIDGYWLNNNGTKGTSFKDYRCQIGPWDGKQDAKDEQIFFYFDCGGIEQIKLHMDPKTAGSEFVITRYYF